MKGGITMGLKHKSSTYAEKMKEVKKLLETNQFKSMYTGEAASEGTFDKKSSLNDLMHHLMANMKVLSENKPHLFLESADSVQDTFLAEQNIERIGEEIESRFTQYKSNHEPYTGDDYRKLDYLSTFFKVYKGAQEELDVISEKGLEYNPSNDLRVQSPNITQYENNRIDFDEAIADFETYTASENYDASFLDEANFNKIGDKTFTADIALEIGIDNLRNNIYAKTEENNRKIVEVNDSFESFKKDVENRRVDAIKQKGIIRDDKHRELTDKISNMLGNLQETKTSLDDELNNIDGTQIKDRYNKAAEKYKATKLENVSKDLRHGGLPGEDGEKLDAWLVETFKKGIEGINEKASFLGEKKETLSGDIEKLGEDILAEEVNNKQLKDKLASAENNFANIENDKEYKALYDSEAPKREAISNIETLIEDVMVNGVGKVDPNRLKPFGISSKVKLSSSEAAEAEGYMKTFNAYANSRAGLRVWGATRGQNLSTAIKELGEVFTTDLENLEKAGDEYEKNTGKKAFEFHPSFKPEKLMEAIDGLKDFDGNLKSTAQASSFNKVVNQMTSLTAFVKSVPDDAPEAVKKAKQSVEKIVNAYDEMRDYTKNPEKNPSVAVTLAAGVIDAFGTSEQITQRALNELRDRASVMSHDYEFFENTKLGAIKKKREEEIQNLKNSVKESDTKLESLNKQKNQKNTDFEYISNSLELLDSDVKLNEFNAKSKKLESDHADVTKRLNDLNEIASKGHALIDKEYEDFDTKLSERCNEEIKKEKEVVDSKISEYTEENNRYKALDGKLNKINTTAQNLKSSAVVVAKQDQKIQDSANATISNIKEQRLKMQESLTNTEKDIYTAMRSSKRFLMSNSEEFEKMMTSMNEYINASEQANNSKTEIDKAAQLALAEKARRDVEAYISIRDTKKVTPTGQLRLDNAKKFIEVLNQKEKGLEKYDNQKREYEQIKENSPSVNLNSNAEKMVIKASVNNLKTRDNFELRPNTQRTPNANDIKIGYKGSINSIKSKNYYLGKVYEAGIKGLAKGDENSVAKGLAAAFVAGMFGDKAGNVKHSEKLDSTIDAYAQTDKIKEIAKQAVQGNIKKADFEAMLSDPKAIQSVKSSIKQNIEAPEKNQEKQLEGNVL